MKKFILLLAIAVSAALNIRAESYVSTHSKLVPEWTLVLPAIVNGKAYISLGLALEIIEVRIDGVLQRPTEGGVARSDASAYPHSVEAVVYRIGSEYLNPHRWKEGRIQDGPLLSYSLPCSAKRIDISYIIHLPDGSRSKEITMTSFEINALEGIERKGPNQASQPTRGKAPRG